MAEQEYIKIYFNDVCLKCVHRKPVVGCDADMPDDFDKAVGCPGFVHDVIFYEFIHGGRLFQHIGWNLFVNGSFHCGIGEDPRTEDGYLSCFKKYSRGC